MDADEAARLRLWQDASLSSDVDLDAVAARHPDDDDVLTLVDLTRETRRLAIVLAVHRTHVARSRRRV
jgi:hypothetical protein